MFDGNVQAKRAHETLTQVANGSAPISRKIDDKMSFHVKRENGKVYVKYKGPGSHYNSTAQQIEAQHGHKPYLAGPLKSILKHIGKVLPKEDGEYQGGFMSDPSTREESGGMIHHTPNTIKYSHPIDSNEGRALKNSKISIVLHSRLVGPERSAQPVPRSTFGEHKDVHVVNHDVLPKQRKMASLSQEVSATANDHLEKANKILSNTNLTPVEGHSDTLRTYINTTVDSGEKPSVEGYKAHLQKVWNKKIDGVKTEKSKNKKAEERDIHLQHVDTNKRAFANAFQAHHHLQQATNILAKEYDKATAGETKTSIGGTPSGGEGYVAGGLKIVDREGFSKANRLRSAALRQKGSAA